MPQASAQQLQSTVPAGISFRAFPHLADHLDVRLLCKLATVMTVELNISRFRFLILRVKQITDLQEYPLEDVLRVWILCVIGLVVE